MQRTWAVSCLMLFSLPVLCNEQAATIRFLSQSEARAVLTTGAERGYYSRLQLPEMRAKTGLALQNMTVEAAREQVRETYGARAEEFSTDEQAALRDIVTALQPLLRTRAPLYARTPWVFIKVDATIEGGLPHTRGDSIVLSDALLARVVQARAKGASGAPVSLWNLLVHEQTHILQRHHPELFVNLYTQSLGFRHVALAPAPPWLIERNVVNPDAPDADWVFPLGDPAGRRWVLPVVLLLKLDQPRMPDDFNVVALEVRDRPGAWEFADRSLPAAFQEVFHPNEISAGLLAALITGSGIEHPEHPLWNKTRAWADQALR
jgi:hypothetical protein